ncbi:RAxF-45 family protein [Virgibacillus indicus]
MTKFREYLCIRYAIFSTIFVQGGSLPFFNTN